MNFINFSIFFINILFVSYVNTYLQWETPTTAMDKSLYEEVLDPELCKEQLRFISNNSLLRLRFLDAGIRIPKGILVGNLLDLGNYHQCLEISEHLEHSVLQGKYCMIRVPLSENFKFENISEIGGVGFDHGLLKDNETMQKLEKVETFAKGLRTMSRNTDERALPDNPISGMIFRLAVCIPRPCTTKEAINSLLFNVTALGFQYEDDFYRLPNDKPWVAADTVAVFVFSAVGILTLLCTCYDIHHTFILEKDSKTANVCGTLFSIYTNGKRLTTFSTNSGTLECIDGVRTLAMLWVIVGHSFVFESNWANPFDTYQWALSLGALWITGAHITVDTFFLLSGLLIVYTTAGKLTGMKLLKNIHLFYLNRILRMFPLLATAALFEASFLNRLTDGPNWSTVTSSVENCRTFWWSTLLHIQNYINPTQTCIAQTWYLAVDVQLHIISPLVLFCVLSGRKLALIGLFGGLLVALVGSTTYNFVMNFPASMLPPNRGHEILNYLQKYYMNTITRGSPFFVGLIFGYLLHLWRNERIQLSKVSIFLLWIAAFTLSTFTMYASYPVMQTDWDNQMLDNLYNSFIRPLWATAVGTMIFLCVQGYGGPMNWFLSLRLWKLPARISYAMYLFHAALVLAINSTKVAPLYFSPDLVMFKALSHIALTFGASFVVTLLVDSPFSTIFKLLLGKASKIPLNVKPPRELPYTNGDKQT